MQKLGYSNKCNYFSSLGAFNKLLCHIAHSEKISLMVVALCLALGQIFNKTLPAFRDASFR